MRARARTRTGPIGRTAATRALRAPRILPHCRTAALPRCQSTDTAEVSVESEVSIVMSVLTMRKWKRLTLGVGYGYRRILESPCLEPQKEFVSPACVCAPMRARVRDARHCCTAAGSSKRPGSTVSLTRLARGDDVAGASRWGRAAAAALRRWLAGRFESAAPHCTAALRHL